MPAIDRPLQCELLEPSAITTWQFQRFVVVLLVYLAWLAALGYLAWTNY